MQQAHQPVRAMEREWLTRKEAARFLASIGCPISHYSLTAFACPSLRKRKGPPFTKLDWGPVRYAKADLVEWAKKVMKRVE